MANVIAESLEAILGKLETFAKSETVVGEPTNIGGVIIVPLVEVSIGAGAGGSSKEQNKDYTTGGGLGARITPSAVLVINNGDVQLVNVKNQDSVNKLIDMVHAILNKFNLKPEKETVQSEIKKAAENDFESEIISE